MIDSDWSNSKYNNITNSYGYFNIEEALKEMIRIDEHYDKLLKRGYEERMIFRARMSCRGIVVRQIRP